MIPSEEMEVLANAMVVNLRNIYVSYQHIVHLNFHNVVYQSDLNV